VVFEVYPSKGSHVNAILSNRQILCWTRATTCLSEYSTFVCVSEEMIYTYSISRFEVKCGSLTQLQSMNDEPLYIIKIHITYLFPDM